MVSNEFLLKPSRESSSPQGHTGYNTKRTLVENFASIAGNVADGTCLESSKSNKNFKDGTLTDIQSCGTMLLSPKRVHKICISYMGCKCVLVRIYFHCIHELKQWPPDSYNSPWLKISEIFVPYPCHFITYLSIYIYIHTYRHIFLRQLCKHLSLLGNFTFLITYHMKMWKQQIENKTEMNYCIRHA